MEKLDYLLWGRPDRRRLLDETVPALLAEPTVRGLTLQIADTDAAVPRPPILLGRGPQLAALAQLWVASYDDRGPLEKLLGDAADRVDGYLVTESEPQPLLDRDWPDGVPSPGITHLTWFPKPERLTEREFLHGWHEVHTPHSAELHPLRWSYVRDTVVRGLTDASPDVRAIVVERFRTVDDYADPKRLFGPPEAFERNLRELPGYADLADISSRPMHEVVVRTPWSR